ncbi:transcriptional regulator [Vibrio sp. STUT-A11]|nr:transcriptional regulator [Vibrio sp. STUT-A11]
MSQQVKQLEEYLDAKLLIRKGRKIALTDQGRMYLPVLNTTFDALASQTHELFGNKKTTTLHIRSTYSFAQNWLCPRLGDFVRQYPNIKVRIIPSNTPIPEESENEPDIEILNGYGNWLDKQVEQITEDEWVVVGSQELLTHYPMPAPIYHFESYPRITTLGYREGWKEWFELSDFGASFKPAMLEASSSCLAIQMAESGAGFLLVKRVLVQTSLDASKLSIVHPQHMSSQSHHYMLTRPESSNQLAVKLFRKWLFAALTASSCCPQHERQTQNLCQTSAAAR